MADVAFAQPFGELTPYQFVGGIGSEGREHGEVGFALGVDRCRGPHLDFHIQGLDILFGKPGSFFPPMHEVPRVAPVTMTFSGGKGCPGPIHTVGPVRIGYIGVSVHNCQSSPGGSIYPGTGC